jgi:hypothetical protein
MLDPGPAHVAAGLEYPRVQAKAAQPMQHVHTGKASTDHDSVIMRANFNETCSLYRSSWRPWACFLSAFPLAADDDAACRKMDGELRKQNTHTHAAAPQARTPRRERFTFHVSRLALRR